MCHNYRASLREETRDAKAKNSERMEEERVECSVNKTQTQQVLSEGAHKEFELQNFPIDHRKAEGSFCN